MCSNISMFRRAGMLVFCVYPILSAGLLRLEVSERTDVLEGRPFGNTGPYERIVGKAYFAVDPKLPANQIITDIDKAPRNDEGKVEFSADVYVLKPRDPKFGNGAVLFEVSNRGRKGMLSMYNRAAGIDRSEDGEGLRRRLPDGAGLHAGVAGMAVRLAAGTRTDAALHARGQGHHRPGALRDHRRQEDDDLLAGRPEHHGTLPGGKSGRSQTDAHRARQPARASGRRCRAASGGSRIARTW